MAGLMDLLCEDCHGDPNSSNANTKEERLHQAVELECQKCIDRVLAAGADVNWLDIADPRKYPLKSATQPYALSPLMRAMKNKNAQVAKLLLQSGADVNKTGNENYTALMAAAEAGNEERMELLINAGADVNTTVVYKNLCALIFAASSGSPRCVKTLINAGADVNILEKYVGTALFRALKEPSYEIVDLLLEAGADVNQRDERGWTALFNAVFWGYTEGVKLRREKGAIVNLVDDKGFSALIYAVTEGRVDCTQLLLEAGADVNIIGLDGSTALIRSVYKGGYPCVRILLKAEARINVTNRWKHNALYWCQTCGQRDTARLLFAAGESPDGTIINTPGGGSGNTPDGSIDDESTGAPDVDLVNKFLADILRLDTKLTLKHLCREPIRNHLLQMSPHEHLFGRVPNLGLPTSLASYLIYNMEL